MENLNEQLQHAGQAYKKLEEDIKGDGEITTLRAAANIVTTPVHGGRQKLKLSAPVTYDGTPGTLKGFLIQVKNYQNFHHRDFTNETEKVVHAATYLRGKALKWFKLIQEEYLKCETLDECTTETRDIYANFKGFEDTLRSLFQDPDEKRQAERDLAQLKQTKSAKDYSANFRQLSVQLDLTEETKIFMFYQGLKDEVKDEIIKIDRPDDFLQYAELAIKIDNRLFERRKERGEKRQNPNSGRKYQWQPQHQFNNQRNDNRPRNNWNNPRQSTAYSHHSRPIDLSVIQRNDKKNDSWKKDRQCYNCQKIGHLAYECRSPKKERFQPTTCFDDNCHIHSSSKEHAGWYPQKPQERSGYDTTNVPKRTLAAGYRSNSKIERKTIERLDSMNDNEELEQDNQRRLSLLYQRQLGALDAHIERRQHAQGDPARIRQINQELEEQVESETTKNTPNDSETPRDVARQHAQLEVAFEVASVDDTSSGEDSDEEIQWYHCYRDQCRVHYIKKDEAWKK
ncbi:reverse transcriptase domain protein [Colletotrichum truncatum]|uniref:Reverse transcriptase domain protein n=1 Tax=Colletotrichum truncatum TaxID=5467 RepID=A0ACC3Z2C4_COLTU